MRTGVQYLAKGTRKNERSMDEGKCMRRAGHTNLGRTSNPLCALGLVNLRIGHRRVVRMQAVALARQPAFGAPHPFTLSARGRLHLALRDPGRVLASSPLRNRIPSRSSDRSQYRRLNSQPRQANGLEADREFAVSPLRAYGL